MEDINKLPKWARHRIEKLEADLAYFKKQLFQIETPGESNTFMHIGLEQKALPKNTRIRFLVGKTNIDFIEAGLDARGDLYINGWDSISIRPQAANAVYVNLVNK